MAAEAFLIRFIGHDSFPMNLVGIRAENHAPVNHGTKQVGVDVPDPQFTGRSDSTAGRVGTPPVRKVIDEARQYLVLVVLQSSSLSFIVIDRTPAESFLRADRCSISGASPVFIRTYPVKALSAVLVIEHELGE